MARFKEKENFEPLAIDLWEYVGRYVKLSKLPEMDYAPVTKFYENLFEKPLPYEGKQIKSKRFSEDDQYIYWPYANRLIYLIRKYISLSPKVRDYIVRCRKVNIFWRGGDIDIFRKEVKATLDYRKLSDDDRVKYRKSALRRLQNLGN